MNFIKKFFVFMVVFISFFESTKAMTPTVDYLVDIYSNRIGEDKTYSGQLGYIRVNGKIVYCVEPFLIIGNNYSLNNSLLNNYNKNDLLYMNLVAHRAKEFIDNDNNWFYYMAAQELIWEKIIGKNKIYYTTQKNGSGSIIDISMFKDDLDSYAKNYLIKPSFDKTVVSDNFYSTVVLEDTNNVLYEYNMINESKNEVWTDGNKLYIRILSSEPGKIRFQKKLNGSGMNYYHSSSNQDIIDFDDNITYTSEISVQANNEYSEALYINFFDSDTEKTINGGIKFKIINLDTHEESEIYTTYNSSYYTQEKYKEGNYKIEIIDVPRNYVINNNLFFSIKEQQNYMGVEIINFHLETAKGKIVIYNEKENTKYNLYASSNIYDNNDNLVYKKNMLIKEIEINQYDNYDTMILPFGKYYLLDLKDSKKYFIDLDYEDNNTQLVIEEIILKEELKDYSVTNNTFDKTENDISNNKTTNINKDMFDKNTTIKSQKANNYLPNTINYIRIIQVIICSLIIIVWLKHEK